MKSPFSHALFCAICIFFFSVQVYALEVTVGNYTLSIDETSGKVNIYRGSVLIIKDSQLSFKVDSSTYSLDSGTASQSIFSDEIGSGQKIIFTGDVNGWTVEQIFYLYDDKNYIATDFTVEAASGTVASNYMAPIKTSSAVTILPSGDNRVLMVPFDNDGFIRYESNTFGVTNTSYEVTALYNESSRQGLIVGSVEHDTWKTGVVTGTSSNTIKSMEIYGGIATSLTRDYIEHGKVNLKKIKSPKIFIGYYSDWRDGLEDYGKVNRLLAPNYYNWSGSWNGKKPFGWNSWAVLAQNINFNNTNQSAEWIANNIQNNGFESEDNTVYMGLDSYWNESGFTDATLKQFVNNCHARGQKAGVYLVPFSYWGSDAPSYALKAGGQPRQLDGGWCIDPTNPGTKNRTTSEFLGRIEKAGFDYIKIDFLCHGVMEADSWYDPSVQTGMQAYNQGMKWLANWFRVNMPNMYVNLSIAPLFPGQYAHSRRISCDAWGSISDTEYELNSLTYGWWLDYVYDYNDADHVKLVGYSEGENRARITSSAITGIFMLGDDYSDSGNNDIKERAKRLLTNAEIIRMAHVTKAFRPVHSGISGNSASEMFYQKSVDGDTTYVAIFNYDTGIKKYTVNFSDLGLFGSLEVTELWSNTTSTNTGSWSSSIPGKDCKVLKIFASCSPSECPDCYIDSDDDGVPDCYDLCPCTPSGTPVDQHGCPIPCGQDIIADFENKVLTYQTDQNISSVTIVDNPDINGFNKTVKALYLTTNSQDLSGGAAYSSGITLNFPAINTNNTQYMHFAFKTNTEKIEFLINGNYASTFNPRVQVSNNEWFECVLDLGANQNLSSIKILFDTRTNINDNICGYFNNHNKYLYIDEIEVNNNSTPRSFVAPCPEPEPNPGCGENQLRLPKFGNWNAYVNQDRQIVINVPDTGSTNNSNKVSVYNISGQKIAEQPLTGIETTINTRLTAGVYLVKLQQNGMMKISKIVVF